MPMHVVFGEKHGRMRYLLELILLLLQRLLSLIKEDLYVLHHLDR